MTSIDKIIVDFLVENVINERRCTKATKKSSSYLKNKKWTKCVRNPNKSSKTKYVRRHWGDPNAKVTGKSGDTKRKKNFRKRHGCKNAPKNSPKDLACKDW
jgi:hypothetical protein